MPTYQIRHGETRSGLVISSFDEFDVKHGGTAVAALVDGASMYVAVRGQSVSLVIGTGSTTVFCSATDTIIDDGTLTLEAAGVAFDTRIVRDGLQLITDGTASGTIRGGETVSAGQTDGAVISSGGVELVLICAFALINDMILVATDGDMRAMPKRHDVANIAYQNQDVLKLSCMETNAAARMKGAMSLIEHEWYVGASQKEKKLFTEALEAVIRSWR